MSSGDRPGGRSWKAMFGNREQPEWGGAMGKQANVQDTRG